MSEKKCGMNRKEKEYRRKEGRGREKKRKKVQGVEKRQRTKKIKQTRLTITRAVSGFFVEYISFARSNRENFLLDVF